ncbi:MAG: hypothetical protein ACYDG2_21325, partial [Ruminiclostridium sp.]
MEDNRDNNENEQQLKNSSDNTAQKPIQIGDRKKHRSTNFNGIESNPDSEQQQPPDIEEIIEHPFLFTDDMGEPHLYHEVDGYSQVWPIRSNDFKLLITKRLYELSNETPKPSEVKKLQNLFEALAVFSGQEQILYPRIARYRDAIYYNLADNNNRVIEISSEGFEIISKPPLFFQRFKNTVAQVEPKQGVKGLKRLLDFINIIDDSKKTLFLVYMVTCLIPDIPHVISVFHGDMGAAKSTAMKIIRKLIDPAIADVLMIPENKENFQLILHTNYMPCFDNLEKLEIWQSDNLCSAATGAAVIRRKRYTDKDTIIQKIHRCICLNGINMVAERPDLLDRSIIF